MSKCTTYITNYSPLPHIPFHAYIYRQTCFTACNICNVFRMATDVSNNSKGLGEVWWWRELAYTVRAPPLPSIVGQRGGGGGGVFPGDQYHFRRWEGAAGGERG